MLDGLDPQAHWTSLRIAEHYTDTAGATDRVFGLCHLLGHRFSPRIKDLKERKLYAVEKPETYPVLKPLIGEAVDTAALIRADSDEAGHLFRALPHFWCSFWEKAAQPTRHQQAFGAGDRASPGRTSDV